MVYVAYTSSYKQRVPHLGRTSTVPEPYFSRTSTVPHPYLTHTSSVPEPYLSRTSAVPQSYLDRTLAIPRAYFNSSVPQPYLKRTTASRRLCYGWSLRSSTVWICLLCASCSCVAKLRVRSVPSCVFPATVRRFMTSQRQAFRAARACPEPRQGWTELTPR